MWEDRVLAFGAKLTAKAPAIVLGDLGIAIAAFWSGMIPQLVLYVLAGVTAVLAFCVLFFGGSGRSLTEPRKTSVIRAIGRDFPV